MRQGLGDSEDRVASAGRTMRVRKVVKPCPTCKADIAEFLAHGQVNRCVAVCSTPGAVCAVLLDLMIRGFF